MGRELPGQLGLFAEPVPGSCPYEIGRYSTKTECISAGRPIWTNCREVGHCVVGFGLGIADIVIGNDCFRDGVMMHLCIIASYVCDLKKGLGL